MPTSTAAKPSHSAKRPGRNASIANNTTASANQSHDTSEPSFIIGRLPYTQPLSSRIANCQIISMPASLSLRHGIGGEIRPRRRA